MLLRKEVNFFYFTKRVCLASILLVKLFYKLLESVKELMSKFKKTNWLFMYFVKELLLWKTRKQKKQ